MNFCLITLGRLIRTSRRSLGISQKELSEMLSYYSPIDYRELSRIENNRIDVRERNYNWLILAISEIFVLDRKWVEQIREQTELQPLHLEANTFTAFPIYLKVADLMKQNKR